MNNTKDLEMQLRMWAPRRPSPKLKEKLFGSQLAPAVEHATRNTEHVSPAFRLSWLVPATVALVAMCLIFNQRNSPALVGSAHSGPMVAMILSNQSAAAYLPASYHPAMGRQNRLDTFEWTNRSASTSSIGSLTGAGGMQ